MKRKYANGLKYQTQALMGATRLASGKIQLLFSRVCIFPFHYPDAGRVALSLQQLSGAAANL